MAVTDEEERRQLQQELALQLFLKRAETDFIFFCKGLTIPGQSGRAKFCRLCEPFQLQAFKDLAPSLQALRDGEKPERQRHWWERTKKASKDADLAMVVAWLCAFPHRPFYGQIGAADRAQAGIVKDRISVLLEYNPWLAERVKLVQNEVRSVERRTTGEPLCYVEIMSADDGGSHGGTPDLLIINELSHIKNFSFAETLLDNANGVAMGLVIVATNAGVKGTGPWKWRCDSIQSDDWVVHILAKPAPWHSGAFVDDARRKMPHSRFRRLWHGEWSTGKGDALTDDAIESLFVLQGPRPYKPGMVYIGAGDLATKRDRAGFTLLEVDLEARKIRMAYWQRWAVDPATGEIDLIDYMTTAKQWLTAYHAKFYYDPHQAVLLAQMFKADGILCHEVPFTPANLIAMASAVQQAVYGKVLELYDDPHGTLAADLGKLSIVEKSFGVVRLEAVRDENGHADVATALSIGMPAAMLSLGFVLGFDEHTQVAGRLTEEVTPDFLQSMPQELRELYELG